MGVVGLKDVVFFILFECPRVKYSGALLLLFWMKCPLSYPKVTPQET